MVYYLTNDRLLGQRIKFELSFDGTEASSVTAHELPGGDFARDDVLILDEKSGVNVSSFRSVFSRFFKVLVLSDKPERYDGCETVLLPLPLGKLSKILQKETVSLRFDEGKDTFSVFLDGEKIPLSKTEFRLLKALADADEAFVSRDFLLSEAFEKGASQSALNVYIHYLREKLEKGNRRLLYASRRQGYALILSDKEECHAENS